MPKFMPKDTPEPPVPPEPEPPKPESPMPKTGDPFSSELVIMLAGCGVALVLAGALMSRKK